MTLCSSSDDDNDNYNINYNDNNDNNSGTESILSCDEMEGHLGDILASYFIPNLSSQSQSHTQPLCISPIPSSLMANYNYHNNHIINGNQNNENSNGNGYISENYEPIMTSQSIIFDAQSHSSSSLLNRESNKNTKNKGKLPFPVLLYRILEDVSTAAENSMDTNNDPIISWEENGKGFKIHQPEVFNEMILPKYSRSKQGGGNGTARTKTKKKTVYRSFQRQLNIYGFKMHKKSGIYYHAIFHRGCDVQTLSKKIRPTPNKTNAYKNKIKNTTTNSNTNSKASSASSSSSYEVENQRARSISISTSSNSISNSISNCSSNSSSNSVNSSSCSSRSSSEEGSVSTSSSTIKTTTKTKAAATATSTVNPIPQDPTTKTEATTTVVNPLHQYPSPNTKGTTVVRPLPQCSPFTKTKATTTVVNPLLQDPSPKMTKATAVVNLPHPHPHPHDNKDKDSTGYIIPISVNDNSDSDNNKEQKDGEEDIAAIIADVPTTSFTSSCSTSTTTDNMFDDHDLDLIFDSKNVAEYGDCNCKGCGFCFDDHSTNHHSFSSSLPLSSWECSSSFPSQVAVTDEESRSNLIWDNHQEKFVPCILT